MTLGISRMILGIAQASAHTGRRVALKRSLFP
jgi:hypothetical protein